MRPRMCAGMSTNSDVENISELIRIFNPEVDSSEEDRHEEECKMCHSEDSNPAYIKGTYVCTECRRVIVNELEKFVEEKNQEIVSRII